MRVVLTSFFVLLFSSAFSQIKLGLKLNPGLAWYRSPSMTDAYDKLNEADPQLSYNNRSVAGVHLGLGGYAEYIKSSKLTFIAELTFNYQNTPYFIYSDDDNRDANGTGNRTEVESNSKIKGYYLSVPLLTKYVLLERQKVYATGGFAFNLMLKPKIISREMQTYTEYTANEITSSPNVINSSYETKLDGAAAFNMQFCAGIGKSFRFAGRSMDIELRYQMPILRTSLVSSDQNFYDNTFNNAVFTNQGRDDLATQTGVNVDDFRNGVFMFSIRYQLKYIDNSEE